MRKAALVLAVLAAPVAAWAQGMPVGPEFVVNTYTTGAQDFPAVASDAAGNFVVAWTSLGQDGAGAGVFGQRYGISGALLGPEFRVNTFTTSLQFSPAVAADGAGNFVVIWGSDYQDASAAGVFGQRFAASGAALGLEFRVNTVTLNAQADPVVAADSVGNFVVVWNSYAQDGSAHGVFAQRFAATGTPLGAEFRVNSFTTGEQRFPSVASDAAGDFVVVWQSNLQDGSSYGVFGQRFASNGAPLGSEFRVNTFTTASQTYPSVAAGSAGDFIVAWTGQDNSNRGIVGQRFAASGAPLGLEFHVNTYTTGYQINAAVTADDAGDFVVIWQSNPQDGDSHGIYGQRYSSGAPLGSEFRVNTYTTYGQSRAAVAADSAGDFVVVWTSFLQDGDAYAAVGQRFSPIVPVSLTAFSVQ